MNTTRIYRVENAAGEGPFQAAYDICNILCRYMNTEDHPGPDIDFNLGTMGWGVPRQMRFGCPSKDKLVLWFNFPDILEGLEALGYHVYVYDIKLEHVHFSHSGKQVMFDATEIEFVERMPISIIKELANG